MFRLQLGAVFVTPGALEMFSRDDLMVFILRHAKGDWGDLDAHDKKANEQSLATGARVLSAYVVGEKKCWIITEADRSMTTILLPDEY